MKASELIKQLEDQIKRDGDLDVFVATNDSHGLIREEKIHYATTYFKSPYVKVIYLYID
jgi:hypothetical protein